MFIINDFVRSQLIKLMCDDYDQTLEEYAGLILEILTRRQVDMHASGSPSASR